MVSNGFLVTVVTTIAYAVLTYVSIRRAASPVQPCEYRTDILKGGNGGSNSTARQRRKTRHDAHSRCFRPVLGPDDDLEFELWTFVDSKAEQNNESTCLSSSEGSCAAAAQSSSKQPPRWSVVETCRSIPISLSSNATTIGQPRPSTFKIDEQCTFTLPQISRMRRRGGGKALRGKFLLRKNNVVVAEAPFELTRMVERPILADKNGTVSGGGRTYYDHLPHFKYRSQRVVLRLVQDDRGYALLQRGDGIFLEEHRGPPCHHEQMHGGCYRPPFYVDDASLRHSSQIEMAESGEGKPPVTLRIKLSLISPTRDVLVRQAAEGMRMAESFLHETELDEIRWLISDENLYRFALTQVISGMHVVIDFLAFRDEVGFYVGRKDMGGLSISSVLTHFVCSLIIFLYLCDAGSTSYVVLGSVFAGVAVDGWKGWKVLKPQWSSSFPFVSVRDPSNLSKTEIQSRGYDRIARLYLGLLLYPLIVGSALYAREHYTYSSWWSWFISNAANAVYTFGFIALCPQLYINYRLKSVAHLPWKVFVYKLFNTFIDDVFAYLIEMPLKHKLMTLRDDLIFVVFLFQAYLYRVDKSRPNEYGYAYEAPVESREQVNKQNAVNGKAEVVEFEDKLD